MPMFFSVAKIVLFMCCDWSDHANVFVNRRLTRAPVLVCVFISEARNHLRRFNTYYTTPHQKHGLTEVKVLL